MVKHILIQYKNATLNVNTPIKTNVITSIKKIKFKSMNTNNRCIPSNTREIYIDGNKC